MKKTAILSRILLATFLLAITAVAAQAQRAMYTTISITCQSSLNTCYSYEEDNKLVNVAGDVVKVVEDGNDGIVCGEGEVPIGNIFMHTPGAPGQGEGYVGVNAYIKPNQGAGAVQISEGTVVYSTFSEWKNALSIITP